MNIVFSMVVNHPKFLTYDEQQKETMELDSSNKKTNSYKFFKSYIYRLQINIQKITKILYEELQKKL